MQKLYEHYGVFFSWKKTHTKNKKNPEYMGPYLYFECQEQAGPPYTF